MSAHTASKPGASLSLLPLLAVLICTLGALVTLLVAYSLYGQDLAMKAAAAAAAMQSQSTDVVAEREDLEWQKNQLQTARSLTQEQLAEKQLELSHVEDHIQRLRRQADEIRIAAEELAKQGLTRSSQFEDAEAELERLRRAIEAAKKELEEQETVRKDRPVTYSVVPYVGPNQTKRRPIYIECRQDAVIVQPENVVLRESDFVPPLGPGNPLAAALRSYSEHLARAGFTGESTRPYPMLLVRPDGIIAYYAARSALESWGAEFGYELVGADWKLDFPPADRGLEADLQRVVAEARVRQEALARAAPRQFKRSRGGMRASPNGRGFVYEGYERGSEFGGSGFAQRNGGGGRGGSGARETGSAWGSGGAESAPGGDRYAAGGTGNEAGTGNGFGEMAGNPGGVKPGGVNDGFGGSQSPAGGDSMSEFGGSPSGAAGQANNQAGNQARQSGGRENPAGEYAGTAGKPQTPGEGRPQLGDANGTGGAGGQSRFGQPGAGKSGSNSPNEMGEMGTPGQGFQADAKKQSGGGGGTSRVGGQPGDANAPSSMGGSEGSSSDGSQGPPSMTAQINASKPKESLANKRGEGWGLPDSNQHMVPVTRPVIVRCEPNQLTIIPDEDRLLPKKIAMGVRTEDSVDALVSGVWDQTKAWGLAGRGMYWKPTLVLEVAPGAEARYAELQQLLSGSGMEVKQRASTATRKR